MQVFVRYSAIDFALHEKKNANDYLFSTFVFPTSEKIIIKFD